MRDGNEEARRKKAQRMEVVSLPMRDGNGRRR